MIIILCVAVTVGIMAAAYKTAIEWDEELKEYERMDSR